MAVPAQLMDLQKNKGGTKFVRPCLQKIRTSPFFLPETAVESAGKTGEIKKRRISSVFSSFFKKKSKYGLTFIENLI